MVYQKISVNRANHVVGDIVHQRWLRLHRTSLTLSSSSFSMDLDHDVNGESLSGSNREGLAVINEAFHTAVSPFLDLAFPLVQEGQWGDYESCLASRIS